VHDTLTENAELLGFKGEDDGPIDKEKINYKNAGGKTAQMGEERQQ